MVNFQEYFFEEFRFYTSAQDRNIFLLVLTAIEAV